MQTWEDEIQTNYFTNYLTAEYSATLLHIRLLRHNELLDFYLDPGMTPSEAGYLF